MNVVERKNGEEIMIQIQNEQLHFLLQLLSELREHEWRGVPSPRITATLDGEMISTWRHGSGWTGILSTQRFNLIWRQSCGAGPTATVQIGVSLTLVLERVRVMMGADCSD